MKKKVIKIINKIRSFFMALSVKRFYKNVIKGEIYKRENGKWVFYQEGFSKKALKRYWESLFWQRVGIDTPRYKQLFWKIYNIVRRLRGKKGYVFYKKFF